MSKAVRLSDDDLIDGLITDALDILHHDRDDDGPIADSERASLRRRFKARLSGRAALSPPTETQARTAGMGDS